MAGSLGKGQLIGLLGYLGPGGVLSTGLDAEAVGQIFCTNIATVDVGKNSGTPPRFDQVRAGQ
jgi:hypothetical protein